MRYMDRSIIMTYLAELIHAQLEECAPRPLPEGVTVEELEAIAIKSHMIYNLLTPLLQLPLPDDVVERLRPRIMKSTMKTLQQVCAAREISEALEKAKIRHQVLKGSVLKFIYPRPEMREMSDIDFMVYEPSLDAAESVLRNLGYDKRQAIKHHVIFQKPPFLVFEMHWSLYEQTVDKEQYLYYKEIRATKKSGCGYTYEFSVEDFYVYMISHMAKHFYEGGCGIRNLLDIYIYQQKYHEVMNTEVVKEQLQRCGLIDFEHHMHRLADIWLGDEESSEFYLELFSYMLDCGIYGKSENGIWGQLAKQEKQNSGYYFPTYNYMKEYYPWLKKCPLLLPVAWFVRGVHGLTSKESRERRKMIEDEQQYRMIGNIYRTLNLDFKK